MANYKIIGGDQKEYGPVSSADIRAWFREKRLNANSLIQAEGSADWVTLGSVAEFADLFQSAAVVPIEFDIPKADSESLRARAVERIPQFRILGCLGASWNLFTSHLLPILGVFTVYVIAWLALIVAAQLIPCIGGIAQMIINPVLQAGMYWYVLNLIRGKTAELSDLFEGFNRNMVHIVLGGIVIAIISMTVALIVAIPFFISMVIAMMNNGSMNHFDPNHFDFRIFLGLPLVGITLMFVVFFFFTVIWMFSIPLIIDKKLNFWEAMELSRKVAMKKFFPLLALFLIATLIGLSGLVLCCFGMLLTLPMAVTIILISAYENLFGDREAVTGT